MQRQLPSYDHWVLRPEWVDVPLGTDMTMSVGVVHGCILVSRITGTAGPDDLERYQRIVEAVLAEAVHPDRPYAHVTEWSAFKGGAHAARKGLVHYLNAQKNLRVYVNCNTSLLLRLSVNAAKRFYAVPYEVLFRDGMADGIAAACRVLGLAEEKSPVAVPDFLRNPPSSAESPGDGRARSLTARVSRPEWTVGDDEFVMENEILDGDVVHTVVKGFMRVRHVEAVIGMVELLAEKAARPRRPYYILADIRQVSGGSLRGRRQYVEATRRLYRRMPFRMYVFYGAKRFARAGVQLARLTVPYRVVLADDFESAMALIREDRHLFGYAGRPSPEEPIAAGDHALQGYVDDVLRYLGSIEWDKEEDREAACPFNPDHPFCGVFDAIDLIRADMKELFKARRQAEIQRRVMEEKLVQSQKMEAVGLLAGGVAHDLNNVLSGIISYPELLLMDMPPEAPMRKPLEAIQASGRKAAAIVEDLLTLSRRGVSVMEPLDINGLVLAYLGSSERRALERDFPQVQVIAEPGADLLAIRGSATHLRKSVASLVANAVESHEGNGTVQIATANCYLRTPVSGYDTVVEGDYVRLSVIDQGCGIPAKDLPRIFEPFYTKKVMGRSGTGLGMAVVWGTVQDHSGYIEVTSRTDQGTAFDLYFPAMRATRPLVEAATDSATIAGQGERVLVVDDVRQQREIAAEMLRRLGYQSATVASGEAALEYLAQTPVNLVVLDMIMDPGIDGLETFRRLRRLYPDQKAIIVSGYADDQKVKLTQAMGAGAFVKKPYTYEDFGRAVRTELDRA